MPTKSTRSLSIARGKRERKQLHVLLSEDVSRLLAALSWHTGETETSLIEYMVRHNSEQTFATNDPDQVAEQLQCNSQ